MKLFFLFITIFYISLNLHATEKSTVYDTTADDIQNYSKGIKNFFDTHKITTEQYCKTKNLFYKIFTKNLRKRFRWADSIQKGEENPERIGIPGSIAVTTGLSTCIATAANPYYTAAIMAVTALTPPVAQGISNYFFQRFITRLNNTYGTYIGLKKKPRTPFENAVLERIWQHYQFPLLLLKDQSVDSITSELLEQLFQKSLNLSSDFEKKFLNFFNEKNFLSPLESVPNLLRYGAERNKKSILGTESQAVEWLATAFTTGINEKPYCCTFYHKAHTVLKIFANIRNFEHPCKADCYSIYGVPLTVGDILRCPELDYSSEEDVNSYFLSPLLQKMAGNSFPSMIENSISIKKEMFLSDTSPEMIPIAETDYEPTLEITVE